MRNFKLIFQYELSSLLGKKSTRITTLILALVALIGTSVPRIITWFDKPEDPAAVVETLPDSDMGYVFASPELHDAFAQALGVTEDNLYPDREALEAALNDRTLRAGAVITSDSQAEVLYLDRELESTDEQVLSDILRQTHRNKFLEEKGITAAEMHAVETFAPQVSVTVLGQDSETNLMLADRPDDHGVHHRACLRCDHLHRHRQKRIQDDGTAHFLRRAHQPDLGQGGGLGRFRAYCGGDYLPVGVHRL